MDDVGYVSSEREREENVEFNEQASFLFTSYSFGPSKRHSKTIEIIPSRKINNQTKQFSLVVVFLLLCVRKNKNTEEDLTTKTKYNTKYNHSIKKIKT